MTQDAIRQVRRFNRLVTQRVGALDDHYMARDRPMGEARVLWEIGAGGIDVRALRRRLGLDSGYLSRVLRALERDGMASVAPDTQDARVRLARLTRAGLRERAVLDRRSDALAWSLLQPLNAGQREQLLQALATVERLLSAGLVTVDAAESGSADARRCLAAYFAELASRFDQGFDPARSTAPDARVFDPPSGLMLVARLHGEAIGCGALRFHRGEPAQIKRMWIAPQARGLGVGRRLLAELENHARQRKVNVVRLDSNRNLTEAIALYRSAGYVEVAPFNDEPYAHLWFEKRLAAGGTSPPPGKVRRARR